MSAPLRVLYLGVSFPPGHVDRHPGVNPAGHTFETGMLGELSRLCDLRSVTTLPVALGEPSGGSDEWSHGLVLRDSPPHAFHRWRSVRRLHDWWDGQLAEGWRPDVVLSYNTLPICNAFILGLRAPVRPASVLLMLDSPQLERRLSLSKRIRMRLTPFTHPDAEMLRAFDGCIGLSREVERHFVPGKVPFLWMPGGISSRRAALAVEPPAGRDPAAPLRFGYFGSLGPHAGPVALAKAFAKLDWPHELVVCGFGKQADELRALAKMHPRIRFDGWLQTAADTLRFGSGCDVLVNPRPPGLGNETNFPSKLFDYALCGRAIVSTRISGTDIVLGPEAFHVDSGAGDFVDALGDALRRAGECRPEELLRRGRAIRERVMAGYSWAIQAERIVDFLGRIGAKR